MGKVFTAEEVRQQHVPTPESFQHAARILRMRLRSDPAVIAALLLGSIVRGDSNCRSDIDCMVVYDLRGERAVYALLNELSIEFKKRFVPLNFIPCDTETAASGMHNFGPGFIGHLENSAKMDGTIKGNVVPMLKKSVSRAEEARSYVRHKLYSLEASYAEIAAYSDEERAAFLKRVCQAPLHVAKKILGLSDSLDDDSKQTVKRLYAESMPHYATVLLNQLTDADASYTNTLEANLCSFDEGGYREGVGSIEAAIPKTITFVRRNALLIDPNRAI